MRVQLDKGAIAPTRAHDTDAGLDLYAMEDGYVPAHSYRVFHTGVHIELPPHTCGILQSKSGLNVKHGLTSTGVVDEGYTGEILVALHNNTYREYYVKKGDKISQLLIQNVRYEPVEIVDKISGGERGECGFGSSGR